ncbi:MAG: lysophospholipid acyltransferase family protein [Bacteroidales bacterium]
MKYIYTFYTWLVGGLYFFILTLFSIVFMTFIPSKKYSPVFRFFLRIMFALLFVRVKRVYAEKIDLKGRYIFMPNHVSLMDAPICAAYMPHFITALEAAEHFKWPLYGKLATLYGNIPIDRKSVQNSIKSVNRAIEVLKTSNSIVVFAEGSRTKDGTVGNFKKLPFQMAKDAGVPIIPVGMSGVFTFNNRNSIHFRPSRLKLKFGKVIPADVVTNIPHEELMDMVRNEIVNLMEYN